VPVAQRLAETAGGLTPYLEAGAGPPVVLLHGGFGGAGNWHRTVGPLSLAHRVVVPDRPGYGLSALPTGVDEVAWLGDFLGALGLERAVLVGHAGGAALALGYARARPAAVRALALSDLPLVDGTPAPNRGEAAAPLGGAGVPAEAARGSAVQTDRVLDGEPTFSATAERDAAGARVEPPRRRPRGLETWSASVGARLDDRRVLTPEYLYYLWCLAQLRPEQDQRPPGELAPGPVALPTPGERTWPSRPCLLVWGRGNRWAGVPLARQLHIRVPDAWLRLIERSKGIPMLEQPGEFNHAVLTFLAAHVKDE
jgi:pimeloyl-ACP methyl ester carboxylesterase